MRRTSMQRLIHIRHLAMMEYKTWINSPASSIHLLKYMDKLRELDLYINEDAWDLFAPGQKAKEKTIEHEIELLYSRKVIFGGEIPEA